MRHGTMTPQEFVSGAGMARIRHEKSVDRLKADAEKAKARFNKRVSELATQRLQMLAPWWHEKFPTRALSFLFGNGSEYARIDGRYVSQGHHNCDPCWFVKISKDPVAFRTASLPALSLEPLRLAFKDVEDITNGYRDGCPDDVIIEPIQQRARRPRWWKYFPTEHYTKDKL